MPCLRSDVETNRDSEVCIATQKQYCCHTCQKRHCWGTNTFCGKSLPAAQFQDAAICGFCYSLGVENFPNSGLCLHLQTCNGWHCTKNGHLCLEDTIIGCTACNKICHKDNSSSLCVFERRSRGVLNWKPNAQDSQDTRMFQQDLQGDLPHRTQLQWRRVGRDPSTEKRVVEIETDYYEIGFAS